MIDIEVTPIDGDPYVVRPNMYVVVLWERKFKRPASDMANQMAMEWLIFLAYEACKQNNIPVPMTLDDYAKKIQSIGAADNQPENPTDGAPTLGS